MYLQQVKQVFLFDPESWVYMINCLTCLPGPASSSRAFPESHVRTSGQFGYPAYAIALLQLFKGLYPSSKSHASLRASAALFKDLMPYMYHGCMYIHVRTYTHTPTYPTLP